MITFNHENKHDISLHFTARDILSKYSGEKDNEGERRETKPGEEEVRGNPGACCDSEPPGTRPLPTITSCQASPASPNNVRMRQFVKYKHHHLTPFTALPLSD